MYFTGPLADLIGEDRPIRRLAGALFAGGDVAVILRHADRRHLDLFGEQRFRRVYFLIDDDLFALGEGDGLPADYRRRLLRYRDGLLRQLLPRVTHVVAPSDQILAAYGDKIGLRLDPAQCYPLGSLRHHDGAGRFEVVFSGTRSHLEDLAAVAGGVAEFLRKRPEARLTTFLGGHAPKALQRLANVRHLPPMAWEDYRRFAAGNRFHAAIAPALDTGFNRARSFSKLLDHAGFGAAGIYSRQPPFTGLIEAGKSGLLLPNEPASWRDALAGLAQNYQQSRDLATGAQKLAQHVGDPGRVRQFWVRELGVKI